MPEGLPRIATVLILLASGPARAAPAPSLDEAVGWYQAMDDARAADAFARILAAAPPGEVAAKAHLYLGLIAFNAFHPDQARAEFEKAILANPAIDLPPTVSPKARIAFAEARRNVTRELEAPEPARKPTAHGDDGRLDATATASAPGGGIPAGTWWLGGFGVATLAAGTVLGVVSNSVSSQDHYATTGYHTISFASAQTAGYEALGADVAFGVGGALLVGAIIWAVVGSGPGSGPGSGSGSGSGSGTAAGAATPVAVAF
jgi:hypothetical protein